MINMQSEETETKWLYLGILELSERTYSSVTFTLTMLMATHHLS